MNKIIFLLWLTCFATEMSAQRSDTINNKVDSQTTKITSLQRSLKKDSANIDSIKKAITKNTTANAADEKSTCRECNATSIGKNALVWLMILLPWLAAFIALLWFGKSATEFNLKDALAENETPKITIHNPRYEKETIATLAQNLNLNEILPPTIDVSEGYTGISAAPNAVKEYRPSISRLIAFFSGALTCIIALSASSFYIYYYICTGCPPDLSGLSTVLIALGIGVTPYVTNKIATAVAARKPAEE